MQPKNQRPADQECDEAYTAMWDAYVEQARAEIEAYAEAYDAAVQQAREQAEASNHKQDRA